MKRRIVLLACALLLLAGTWTTAANGHSISLEWALPTHTVSNDDCAVDGYLIPETKPIISQLQWRIVGGAAWTSVETADRINAYTITNLPPETTYEIRVGSHLGDGQILCWTEPIQATTPAYTPPRPCGRPTILNVQ